MSALDVFKCLLPVCLGVGFSAASDAFECHFQIFEVVRSFWSTVYQRLVKMILAFLCLVAILIELIIRTHVCDQKMSPVWDATLYWTFCIEKLILYHIYGFIGY